MKEQNIYIELDGVEMPEPLEAIKNSEWRKFNTNLKPSSQELSSEMLSKYEKEFAELRIQSNNINF